MKNNKYVDAYKKGMKKYADGATDMTTPSTTDPTDDMLRSTKAFAPSFRDSDPTDNYSRLGPESIEKVKGFISQLSGLDDDALMKTIKSQSTKSMGAASSRDKAGVRRKFSAEETIGDGLLEISMSEAKRRGLIGKPKSN